jgi:hypothetical protein
MIHEPRPDPSKDTNERMVVDTIHGLVGSGLIQYLSRWGRWGKDIIGPHHIIGILCTLYVSVYLVGW